MSRMTEQIGRVLGGRYRLLAPIGRGASAQVFVADDVRLRRQVAVKVLHDALADDQEFLRRFRTEAQAAAALNHPHVMAVYDWGQDNDEIPWIVTEYLGGGSLRALLDRGHRLTPSQALVVGLQAARGLDYAHQRGFVHRDVKPANLLFDDDGRLRIADFGLARALAEAAWTEPQGAVVGTARYASPEQAQGSALTGRADVYSLALVLVETVTGEVPFATDTTLGTLMARVGKPLVVPDALGPLAGPLAAAGDPDPDQRIDGRGLTAALTRVAPVLPRPAALPLAGATDEALSGDHDPTELSGPRLVSPSRDDLEVPAFVLSSAVRAGNDGESEEAADEEVDLREADRTGAAWRPDDASPDEADDPTRAGFVGSDDEGADEDDHPDEDDDGSDDWDPRSPTGHRRRWPGRIFLVLVVLAVGAVVGMLARDLSRATPSHAMPTVTDLSVEAATANLEDLGWDVEVRSDRRDGTEAGDVLGTDPAQGTEVDEGEQVTLVVSEGATLVDRPELTRGMTEQEATDLLTFSGLEADIERTFDEEVPADVVISVVEGLPARIEKGTSVALVVSQGPAPRAVPDDLAGMSQDDAVAALQGLGLVAEVREDFSDEVPAGQVIGTEPGAGSEAARDSTVVVAVSKGPDLVSVPDVSGAGSLADAVDALEAAGLVAGEVRGPAAGSPSGTAPAVGEQVRRGSEVDISLE
ncbi:MAG: protein kinase domain-containing protein [Iamia sp.]